MENSNNQKTITFYRIDEEFAQQIISDNLGRELTEKELKRLALELVENTDVLGHAYDLILTAAKEVMDDKDERWSEYDKNNENTTLKDMQWFNLQ